MKALVVYFSHDKENYVAGDIQYLEVGNTKRVASMIAETLQADSFEIKPLHDYPEIYNECTELAKKELENNERPHLLNVVSDIKEYTDIYLGYPNWWGTMPMCVWTFLESYDFTGKTIHPFVTHEGSGLGHSVQDIQKLCPQSVIEKGLAIRGSQVSHSLETVKQWLNK